MLKERVWVGWLGVCLLLAPFALNIEQEWLWYAAQVVVLASLSRVFICAFFTIMLVVCAVLYSVTNGAVLKDVSEQMEVEMLVYMTVAGLAFLDLLLRRRPY